MSAPAALVAIALGAGLVTATSGTAAAQTSEAAFQDATGPMWGLATFELGLLATGVAVGIYAGGCQGLGCIGGIAIAGLGGASSLVLGLGVGIGTGFAEVPADVPFVFHHTLFGFGAVAALGIGIALLADDDEPLIAPALIAGAVAAAGFAAYAIARRDDYIRDPDAALPAHLMTWTPFVLGAIGSVILAGGDAEPGPFLVVLGLAILGCYGASVAWAESEIASEPAMVAPLVSLEL
jgi:hypothetical protein